MTLASPWNGLTLLLSALLLMVLWACSAAEADAMPSGECAECHAEREEDVPYVVESMLAEAVHEGFDCVECHSDIADLPHEEVAPVDCGICHDDIKGSYANHGRGVVGEMEDLPNCSDCHGTHHILHSSDEHSSVNSMNLPRTCGRCHEDIDLVKRHEIRIKHPVESYMASVHGKSSHLGSHVAASCTDCHSTNGSGHNIDVGGDVESTVNHFNIPSTCGKCHSSIEQDFWDGIHGQLVLRGDTDAPVCTHCHGEHGILRTDDPQSRVSPIHVAGETCAPCHESTRLSQKYGIPGERLTTFIDSYHGLKSKAGDLEVANCASCHGAHRILPSTDPESSIHLANLRATCGNCHPGVTEVLAATKIHEGGVGRRSGWSHIVTQIYLVAIFIIIGGMVVYVGIDFQKQFRRTLELPQVVRMTPGAVAQHHVLLISFAALAITGFALRYPAFLPFRKFFGWDGGAHVRGITHRSAAVIFLLGCAWHLVYVWTKGGRKFLRDMLPVGRDFSQFGQMLAYNLGKRRKPPRFTRFGYVEKAEYWALVWGAGIMAISGIILWFDTYFIQFLPKGFLDVMLVVHHYEAWLATLAILVWHLYSVLFNPGVFPGNPAWLTGKMPEAMYRHEHAGDQPERDEAGTPRDDEESS